MSELVQFAVEHWKRPLTAGSIAMLLLILFDKLLKDLIIHQFKRIFHLDQGIEKYAERQIRIEKKVDMLLHERGLVWVGVEGTSESTQTNLSWYCRLLQETNISVKNAVQSWRSNMGKINKAILLPLLSAIALFIKESFGVNIEDQYVDVAADVIMYAIMLAGIFIHPRKQPEPVDPFLQADAKE